MNHWHRPVGEMARAARILNGQQGQGCQPGMMFTSCRSGVCPALPCVRRLRGGHQMNELEQLVHEVRGFATEVRRLGYSSVASGHENQFLELSERMIRRVDGLNRPSN